MSGGGTRDWTETPVWGGVACWGSAHSPVGARRLHWPAAAAKSRTDTGATTSGTTGPSTGALATQVTGRSGGRHG